MNGPQSVMAVFSSLVYSVNDKKDQGQVRGFLDESKLEFSLIYPSLSLQKYSLFTFNRDMFSYVNNEAKIAVVAYRGTEDGRDIMTDINLAIGGTLKRIQSSLDFVTDLVKRLANIADYQYYITGHSLGGYFAEKVTCNVNVLMPQLKVLCASFNAGSSPLARTEGIPKELVTSGKLIQDNILSMRIKGDVVSNTTLHGKDITLEKLTDDSSKGIIRSTLDAHHLTNFLQYVLKREELLNVISKGGDLTPFVKIGFNIPEITQEYIQMQQPKI